MAVVEFIMDPKQANKQHLGPFEIQESLLALQLFHHLCSIEMIKSTPSSQEEDLFWPIFIESISYNSPLKISAFFKNVSVMVAEAVLSRTIFFESEQRKRRAEAGIKEQEEVSAKLDNIRKGLKIMKEYKIQQNDPIAIEEALRSIVRQQNAVIRVSSPDQRRTE